MVILTTEQAKAIKRNLAYNYWIIDRAIICLSIKSKILNQDENVFIGMIIDEAAGGSLINRLYEKDSGGNYYDSLDESGAVPASLILGKLADMFGLPKDILAGKRRINLGIEYPEQIAESNLTLQADIKDFIERHPEWSDVLNELEAKVYVQKAEDYAKQPSFKRNLQYNPLGINPLRAFLYIIEENKFELPEDFFNFVNAKIQGQLISDFIVANKDEQPELVKTVIAKILKKTAKKKGKAALTAQEEAIALDFIFEAEENFKDQFVYNLFHLYDQDAKLKENVYSLDSLIHSIADNTFDYFFGYKDKGKSIWRFLSQRDRTNKLYTEIVEYVETDNAEFDFGSSEELNGFLSDYTASYENEISLIVPMPLKLNAELSELFKLIIAVENLGYMATTSGEGKEVSIYSDYSRTEDPVFADKDFV